MTPDRALVVAGLTELIGAPVTITGAASVGAQRSTLFVDIDRDQAARFGITMPDQVPLSHQERAYTSPIWYTP